MRAVQVAGAKGPLEVVERKIPEPGPGSVGVKVEACGICHSDFVTCRIAPQVPGITYDGVYAEYMVAPAAALALIPDGLSAVDAAPLMCAGSLRSTRFATAAPGPATRWPCSASAGSGTWAFSSRRGWASGPWPSRGARTRKRSSGSAAHSKAMSAHLRAPLDPGLAVRYVDRLAGHARLQRADRRAMTEVLPLERAAEGYERMMSGKARFRVVLTMG
jgi:D-arabinose 1-dehydrogenase-like Zn-dependent alcohol dehydrogenase